MSAGALVPLLSGSKSSADCRVKTSRLPVEFWAFSSLFAAKSSAHGTGLDSRRLPLKYHGLNALESRPLRLEFLAKWIHGLQNLAKQPFCLRANSGNFCCRPTDVRFDWKTVNFGQV